MVRCRTAARLPVAAVAAAVALAACGGANEDGTADSASTTSSGAASPCTKVSQPAPKTGVKERKPAGTLDPSRRWTATVVTNCGTFAITLDVKRAPTTTASFASLARRGFYDGLTFHRIVPGFVIQGGDPKGDGTGGPGYSVVEQPPRKAQYTHGVVAMAKTATEADGTSGSQFFIVTGEDAGLPAQYAILGTVTSGLDVVDRIGALPLATNDSQGSPPVAPVVIAKVAISSSG